MAWLRGRTDTERTEVERDTTTVDRPVSDRAGTSPGLIRALFTLAGVAVAGFLLWVAQLFDLGGTDEFWAAMAIVAGAGVVLGLSQLFGGWTKWGWPTMSPTVFLLGFLPTLVVGGWILLARQPDGGWQQGRFDGWTGDIGVTGFVDAMVPFLPVIALVIGLVFAFSFDTTGPRLQAVDRETVERDRTVPDEDVHDYRGEEVVRPEDEPSVAERLRTRDDETAEPVERVEPAEPAATTRIDRPTDRT
jgi:hypothetical protein